MCLDSAFMSIVVKFAVCFFWTVFNTELLLSSLHAHKSALAVINHMLILNLFKRTVSDAEMNYIHQGGYVSVCSLVGCFVSRITQVLMNGFLLHRFSYFI